MSAEEPRGIPAWIWGIAVAALVVVVALLVAGDRTEDLSEDFRFDVSRYTQVDSSQVLFAETGRLEPGLTHLSAVAIGPGGRVHVAGAGAVVVYDVTGSEVERYPVEGTPGCMAVAPDGEILLGMRDHIAVLDAHGAPQAPWPKIDEKAYITSIAVDEGSVFVADAGQRVVLRFGRDGALLDRLGEEDRARGIPGFIVPSPFLDVAIDQQGALWVVNPGRHGLENYREDGELMSSWYRPSMEAEGFGGCCNPTHIAFGRDGALVTTEKGLSRVKVYGPDRVLLGFVAPPGAFDEDPDAAFSGDLESPLLDLAVDEAGRVLVVDGRRRAVRIFEQNTAQHTDGVAP